MTDDLRRSVPQLSAIHRHRAVITKLRGFQSLADVFAPMYTSQMRRRTFIFSCLTPLLALFVAGCKKDAESSPSAKLSNDNVLFITLDTTRADRIGCYKYALALTPTLDRLATKGVLFEQAFTAVPLTLPSHCSIMTGRYPREHGIRDNGAGSLGDQYPTLAEVFKEQGYRTGAFVAAFVLDHQFGLTRGFDHYADDMNISLVGTNRLQAQIPGNDVADRALAWLGESSDKPFFCWVHFFDAHDPHEPPPGFSGIGRGPYDGEIAFVDSQVKRLTDWLDRSGIADDTLIVIIGDHGETLGERNYTGHTDFVWQTNLHVPFLMTHSRAIPQHKRVTNIVESIDVFPTIYDLFGWSTPDGLMGQSLVDVMRGDATTDGDAYSETLFSYNTYHWAEQRSLTTPDWKYISSTKPELFDRTADPNETRNVIEQHPRIAADFHSRLVARLNAMVPGKAVTTALSASASSKLASLGYVGASATSNDDEEQFLTPGLTDPKDMIEVIGQMQLAHELAAKAKTPDEFRKIIPLLVTAAKHVPDAVASHTLLGRTYQGAGMFAESIAPLERALEIDGAHAGALTLLAQSLLALGKEKEAFLRFNAAVEISPDSPELRAQFGEALESVGRLDEARKRYEQALTLAPELCHIRSRLCILSRGTERFTGELAAFEDCVTKNPKAEDAIELAVMLVESGACDRAMPHLRWLLDSDPASPKALVAIGVCLREGGQPQKAIAYLARATKSDDVAAEAHYQLGLIHSKAGRRDQAAQQLEQAIELQPEHTKAVTHLALYYVRSKRLADAVRVLSVGAQASPDAVDVLNALGQILATCDSDLLRDGKRAVELLEHAAILTQKRDLLILTNLAAAYAAAGRFGDAVEAGEYALTIAERSGNQRAAAKIHTQLELYRSGEAFRDPRLKG